MAISEKTITAAKAAREALLNAADALQALIDGETNAVTAARACGMAGTYPGQDMNRNLAKAFQPYIKTKLLSIDGLAAALEDTRTPGDELLFMVFGLEEERREPDTVTLLPGYDPDRLWELVRQRLTPREAAVMMAITGEAAGRKQTFAEISRDLNLTMNRIGQIKAKSLRKLRHPNVIKALFPAMTVRNTEIMERIRDRRQDAGLEAARAAALRTETKVLENAAGKLRAGEPLSETEAEAVRSETAMPEVTIDDARTQDGLAFSIRCYNCLNRAGIRTLNQLINMPLADIMKIRNLGMKSVTEIRSALLYHFKIDRKDLPAG